MIIKATAVRFGLRLTLFFAVTLLVIQVTTIVAVQTFLRQSLLEDGRTQVAAAETRFVRQLAELQDQLAEGVRLLTLDFALRQSIAGHDAATVVSALRNHGHRIGASRMMLIEPDGVTTGDTMDAESVLPVAFPYPALLDRAADDERAGGVAMINGKPTWLVVVPVMAPDLIAFIAAALPLDSAQLQRIHDISGVPGQIGIVALSEGEWRTVAGVTDPAVVRQLPDDGTVKTMTGSDGNDTIVITRALAGPITDSTVRVVLDYPLSEVMRRYQRVSIVLLPILIFGMVGTLVGATLISRGVARPIETLARQTERIATGDYTPPPRINRSDELGQLSTALRGMTRAIAEREDSIRHQATHDPVTGLANRTAVAAAIQASAAESRAILVFGLVRWRDIASTVGREVGDRVLCDAAGRVQAAFERDPDVPVIGRIGGSSFAVLLENAGQDAAIAAAKRIVDVFETPYHESELTIDAAVAAGIALFPEHGADPTQLLRRAEVALSLALTAEARVAVYRPETDPHRPDRLSLMSEMRVGLTRGEFRLAYQPKLDLKQDRITGAEALVRWTHPTRGQVFPDDFITFAEETGNIQHLTRWALRTGLTEAARWRDQDLPARVAINLSVRDLGDDKLPERVSGLLREMRLSPRALVLEVTESAIMGEPEAAIAVLRRLDELGIDLAIDDFGVGQSSLAYLRRLPVREIKLDKALVRNLPRDANDQTIVRSVIELGHGLGYRVTAEGVEDAATLELLREYGCDYAQGYYIGRPGPPDVFLKLAASWHETGPTRLIGLAP